MPDGSSRETDELQAAQSRTRRARPAPIGSPTATGRPTSVPVDHHARVEQLRAVSVSREGHSALHHQRDRRHPGAALRRRPERARLAARRRSLPRRRSADRRRASNGEVYNIGGGNQVEERRSHAPDPASWSASRRRSSSPSPIGPATIAAIRSTRPSSQRSAGQPQVALRAGPGRHRRLVPAERVVVAADQGQDPAFRAYYQAQYGEPRLIRRVAGPPLVTGATGFAGSHLLDRCSTRGERVARLGASAAVATARCARPRASDWDAVDLLDRAAVARRARRRCGRRSSITAPASRTSATPGSTPARALRVNVLGTHHLLEAVRDAGLDAAACSSPARRSSTARRTHGHRRGRIRSARQIRTASASWRRRCSPTRIDDCPAVIVRPFNHAGPRQSAVLRDVELRAADRRDRSRPSRARAPRRQPRRAARHHRRPRHRPRLRRARRAAASRARPYNVCSRPAPTACASCSTSCCRCPRCRVRDRSRSVEAAAERQSGHCSAAMRG